MKRFLALAIGCTALVLTGTGAFAADRVVASIKPIHGLVAGVMQGVGDPDLLVAGAGSPHTYSLRPSEARALQSAGLVFWIGPDLEAFLEKPVEALAGEATVVELLEAPGLTKLALREGGAFEAHDDHHEGHDDDHAAHDDDHAAHDHDDDHATHDHDDDHAAHDDDHAGHDDDHAAHDHDDDHATHDHDDDHAAHDDDHAGHDDHDKAHSGHGHGAFDAHVWLDPENAVALVREIERALIAFDAANAAQYKANADALQQRLVALSDEMRRSLAPVKDRPFVVFHDAYQNLEHRFGLSAVGSITISPEVVPGAERVAEIKAKIRDLNVECVFSEPQFEPKLVSVVTEGTGANIGVLDPLGADIEPGPDLYFDLMRQMAASMTACLSPKS